MPTIIKAKYPQGVLAIFFMQMFSMVGFSILFAILTLYCIHVLHFSNQKAFNVTEAFNAQVFALSVLGGYLGNRLLGYRLVFIISAILAVIGYIFLSTNLHLFYYGLSLFALSQGLMVPSIFVLLGTLYKPNDIRRDSGFILAYIGMNIGSLFASIISGYVSQNYGYHLVLIIGLVFCCFTFISYGIFSYKIKKHIIDSPNFHLAIKPHFKVYGIFLILIFIPVITVLLKYAFWNNIILISLAIIIFLYLIITAFNQQKDTRKKVLLFLLLSVLSILFWALYLLAPTVLPLFTEQNVNRNIFSTIIPAASFSSLNPFFIIILGPLTGWLWFKLGNAGKKITTVQKFSFGLLLMGMGYLILGTGILNQNSFGYIFCGWIVISYFLQTLGELCVGPIGYAMIGDLAPANQEGIMMGVWQLMSGIAGVLTNYLSHFLGKINSSSPLITNHLYLSTFLTCGSIVIVVGLLTLIGKAFYHSH